MKKKIVSFMLATIMTISSISSVGAAQAEPPLPSSETLFTDEEVPSLPESETSGTSQTDVTQTEGPQIEIPQTEIPQTEIPQTENSIPELPDGNTSVPSDGNTPELPDGSTPELPNENETTFPDNSTESAYQIEVQGDADVYFLSDLKKLKEGTLADPVKEQDMLSEIPDPGSNESELPGNIPEPEFEQQTDEFPESDPAKTAAIEAAKKILPEDVSVLLTEESYDLLKKQVHEYDEGDVVDFYAVPMDGFLVDEIIATSQLAAVPVTDLENGGYEMKMPASDVLLDITTKQDIPETEEMQPQDESEAPVVTPEVIPEIECTCLCMEEDPYMHDWNCDLFLYEVEKNCTCGSGNAPITEHDFSCDAVKKAFAAVCTCGIGGMDGVMHDDCEILSRLHKELCGCTEECRTIEAAQAHGEDSAVYQYLIKWSEYCNQPVWAYDNPDAMQGDKKTSPIASLVGDTYTEDKNYAFSFAYHPGTAPNGGFKDFNSSKVKKITVEGQGSNCYNPTDMKNKKAVVSRRYYNVGVYNGKKIDVELFLSDPLRINTTYTGNNLKPFVRFYDGRIGIGQGLVHDIKVQFKFWENNTNTEVKPKGHITIKDLDGSARSLGSGFRVFQNNGVDRLSIYNKKYTIGTSADKKKQLTHLAVGYRTSNSSGKSYTLIKGRHYYNGGDGRVDIDDKKGWASIYFDGSFIIRVQLGDDVDAPATTIANRHAGVYFDTATSIGTYTPDAPAKRCGPTNVEYDAMSWHNSTDGSSPAWQRPLDTVPGGTYRYGIRHTTYPMAYSSYSLTDKLDSCLTYVNNSALIKNEAGENVTGNFSISYDAKTHTITFTPKSLDSLNDHKQVFSYHFNVKLANAQTIVNHEHHENTSYYYLQNTATVNVNGQKLNTNVTYFRGQIKGSYHIRKYDKENNSILSGAKFEVQEWDENQNKFIHYSNIERPSQNGLYDTGVLTYTSGNLGKFKIIETTAPQGYDGGWSREFNVLSTADGATFDAPNEQNLLEYGTISIIKKDKYTNEVLTSTDGEFQVWQWSKAQNKYLDDLGESGKVEWKKYASVYKSQNLTITDDNLGKFKVVETKNPTGYEGKFEREFVLTPNETAMDLEIEALNDPVIPPLGHITVTKKIKESDIVWAHGNPIFRFEVSGTDVKGNPHTYEDYVEFSKGNYNLEGGYAALSVVFKDIPIGTYTISEKETLRYKFESATPDSPNVTISGQVGKAALDMQHSEAGMTFINKKTDFSKFSHTDVVKNNIPIKW